MTYESFLREMYRQNCDERRNFKDVILSYEDYVRINENFLLDIFEEVCNNHNTD